MIFTKLAFLTACFAAAAFGQLPQSQPPWAKSPKVEMKGTIERVQITPGQGMPYLEMKGEKGTRRVMLGSMRYLMEQNFNPKAGSFATVKGFLVNDSIIAQSVSIPSEKITIQLRDENGVPLWRMGRSGWKEK